MPLQTREGYEKQHKKSLCAPVGEPQNARFYIVQIVYFLAGQVEQYATNCKLHKKYRSLLLRLCILCIILKTFPVAKLPSCFAAAQDGAKGNELEREEEALVLQREA